MRALFSFFTLVGLLTAWGLFNSHLSTQKKETRIKTLTEKEYRQSRKQPRHMKPAEKQTSVTDKLQTFYSCLPRLSDFRSRPHSDEVHFTPKSVLEAANTFTEIETKYFQKENYDSIAQFYATCARNEDFFSSVRSVCLLKLSELNKELKYPYDLSQFPEPILKLSQFTN